MNCEEVFLLKWNNHQNNLIGVFKDWLDDESFVDVTLVCDGEVVPGHKMVLAACSPLLNRIFHDNPCRHPVLILNDVPFNDMKALMDFIYQGEVSVSQRDLPSFLRTADNLQIKGLAEDREKDERKRKDRGDLTNGNNRKRQKHESSVCSSQSVQMHSISSHLVSSSPTLNKQDTCSLVKASSVNSVSLSIPSIEEMSSLLKDRLGYTASQNDISNKVQKVNELVIKTEPDEYNGEMVWQEGTSIHKKSLPSQNEHFPTVIQTDAGSSTNTHSDVPLSFLTNNIEGSTTKYLSSPSGILESGDEGKEDEFRNLLDPSDELSQTNSLSLQAIEVMEEDALTEGSPGRFRGRRKPCCFCGKTFCDNYTLRRHMVTHISRERQFECHSCNAAYSRKDHLMAHIRRKHPISAFEVEVSRPTLTDLNH